MAQKMKGSLRMRITLSCSQYLDCTALIRFTRKSLIPGTNMATFRPSRPKPVKSATLMTYTIRPSSRESSFRCQSVHSRTRLTVLCSSSRPRGVWRKPLASTRPGRRYQITCPSLLRPAYGQPGKCGFLRLSNHSRSSVGERPITSFRSRSMPLSTRHRRKSLSHLVASSRLPRRARRKRQSRRSPTTSSSGEARASISALHSFRISEIWASSASVGRSGVVAYFKSESISALFSASALPDSFKVETPSNSSACQAVGEAFALGPIRICPA
mmetsp:Transcript_1804/g.4210  ORF Transcript_1804/g.4210 Transcript_1804/m.4210 type:complete len:271 (-) Transcript_1804:79-891(-)